MKKRYLHQAGIAILGSGRALPKKAASSAELDREHGLAPGSIETATGVQTRFVCTDENQIDLAVMAARRALISANLGAQDIDMIISAAAVPYQAIPSTAPLIQQGLGIPDGTCFGTDINCTCLSFPMALHLADGYLRGHDAKILIVASELASRGLPWVTQPDVAGLFGDGAGAVVVGTRDGSGLRAAHFVTYPSLYDACQLAAGGTRFDFERDHAAFAAHAKFTMDGKALFRITAKHFGHFVDDLLDKADTSKRDITRVIAHQASPGALAHLVRVCGFAPDQVVNIAAQFGNQIAASIPFVLDHAMENGQVRSGDRIALLGTSAGVSFGGIVLDV